eukprot:Platyproteum_vivax@DN1770_c0_g1_i1.p1
MMKLVPVVIMITLWCGITMGGGVAGSEIDSASVLAKKRQLIQDIDRLKLIHEFIHKLDESLTELRAVDAKQLPAHDDEKLAYVENYWKTRVEVHSETWGELRKDMEYDISYHAGMINTLRALQGQIEERITSLTNEASDIQKEVRTKLYGSA